MIFGNVTLDIAASTARFAEVGRMLGWGSASGVLMLWGFFDESGEHAPRSEGGRLVRLTLGGCWADFAAWQSLSLEWASALEGFGIRVFHATDFFANRGDFKGWEDRPDDHKKLLNALIDTIIRYVPQIAGFSELTPNGDADFRRVYENNLISMLANSSFSENPAIVLARHNDYRGSQIGRVVESAENAMERLGFKVKTWTVGEPADFCPLQVADLIAYELAHWARDKEYSRPMRYPLKRLHESKSVGWFVSV